MKKVFVLDCETTGIDNNPKTGKPDIIELAHIDLSGILKDIQVFSCFDKPTQVLAVLEVAKTTGYSESFKPELSIHPEAYKIHGKRFIDLLQCRHHMKALEHIPKTDYLLGHKVSFDYRCLGKPEGIKLICTEKLARRVKKLNLDDYPNVQLDTLVRHYYPEFVDELIQEHHGALSDCIKTILVFGQLLTKVPGLKSWDEVYHFCEAKI